VCGVSECCHEVSIMGRPLPTKEYCAMEEKKLPNFLRSENLAIKMFSKTKHIFHVKFIFSKNFTVYEINTRYMAERWRPKT